MPSKSRYLYDSLIHPSLAYWPGEHSWRCRRQPTRRSLYNDWVNCLVDELMDPKSPDIEMEIEHQPKDLPKEPAKEQSKEPMEVDSQPKSDCPPANCANKVEPAKSATQSPDDKQCDTLQQLKPTELHMRVSQYKPEDISVEVKDNLLTVRGKRERRTPSGSYSCQQFERTFTLPKDADQEKILCSMDASGLIKLNIPRKELKQAEEQVIKIVHEKPAEERKPVEEPTTEQMPAEEAKKEETTAKILTDDKPVVEDLIEE